MHRRLLWLFLQCVLGLSLFLALALEMLLWCFSGIEWLVTGNRRWTDEEPDRLTDWINSLMEDADVFKHPARPKPVERYDDGL